MEKKQISLIEFQIIVYLLPIPGDGVSPPKCELCSETYSRVQNGKPGKVTVQWKDAFLPGED